MQLTAFPWPKYYVEFNTQKLIEAEKNWDKDEKSLHKSMDNDIYSKAMENLENKIDRRLLSNEKRLFEMDIKTKVYVTKNIWQQFGSNL